MAVSEKINEKIEKLPPSAQEKVLDFVEFLSGDSYHHDTPDFLTEEKDWQKFSLSQVLKDMADEDLPEYTEADLKEKWR
jgi:hypothetical protein